jgi:hypothetical protein
MGSSVGSTWPTLLVAALLTAWARPALAADYGTWKHLYEKEGMTGWHRQTADSRFHELRAVGVIEADIFTVTAVYKDSDRSCEWLADCVAAYAIERDGVDVQTTYNRFRLGWPLKDRDFVFAEQYVWSPGGVIDTMRSTDHPKAPVDDGAVRAQLINSSFEARSLGPGRTWIDARLQVDPGGSIPAWLVNAFTRSWPWVTFRDLRDQAEQPRGYEAAVTELRRAHPEGLSEQTRPIPEP